MRRSRRPGTALSLSFLDIMACGFGAATLLFLLLKHAEITRPPEPDPASGSEVNLLVADIREGERELATLRNARTALEEEIRAAQGRARKLLSEQPEPERSLRADPEQELASLREEITRLEEEVARLRSADSGAAALRIAGEGRRQYLTGLRLGGARVLILVDASASMLDETIVEVIRRRIRDHDSKLRAPKWQRATRTAAWLVAHLPQTSDFQLYAFNTDARPTTPDSTGRWLQVSDTAAADTAVRQLRATAPQGGTSLINAFAAVRAMSPPPDNLILLTDGLPTWGRQAPRGNTVDPGRREQLFREATEALPAGLPVNVILFPMEGDPAAASLFWQLGVATGGSFLSPARDWP